MLENNLNAVDLNLLKILSEIERQGSVTGAAQALGLGQPAVSQALARLRATLKDDLFVRGPGGMVPTPKVLDLIGPVRTALGQLEHSLFGSQAFDASTSETRFMIGASDYTAAIMTPEIMRVLADNLPLATLAIMRTDRSDAEHLLADGKIDIALGMFPKTTEWIKRRRLFRERHVCVFNPDVLALPDPLSVKDYAAQDHVLVSLDGSAHGFVDTILERDGLSRRIAITTPFFLQCAYLLERLPLIATLPERFVRGCSTMSKLAIRPVPFETPAFDVSAAWRAGDDRNPRLSALKDTVFAAAKALADPEEH